MANPIAEELNGIIRQSNPHAFEMLSELGRELYFPKGILSQSAEAKEKAHRFNATIGIAKEAGKAMHLNSVMRQFAELGPDEVLPYAATTGKTELRNLWKQQLVAKNPKLSGKATSLPLVTCGVTHGLSLVADLFVDPGDLVLIPDKVWGNYRLIFGVRKKAKMVDYPFFSASGGLDVAGFQKSLETYRGGKLVVILNFPNNPTGYSPTEAEAQAIARALKGIAKDGTNVVAVFDDAYFGLFYDEAAFKQSIFACTAESHERIMAIKLDGATKEDFVWGFRTAFITFSTAVKDARLFEALEKKTGGAIRGNVSNCSLVSQTIIAKAMSDPNYAREKQEKFTVLKERALKVREVLSDGRFSSAWEPYPFNSGYFMCVRMKRVRAEDFRVRLLEKYGVGVIVTDEYDVRIAFSCIEKENIPKLFEIMYQCAGEMECVG